ncbi:MAG: hypothetical protein KA024_02285 [Zoogloea sp.]|nr:hypothetical protein [Zoogloea sp.]
MHQIAILILAALLGGCIDMSSKAVELKWEWPAGRHIESKLLINVSSIKRLSSGPFGVKLSPSLADALPEATEIEATVVIGEKEWLGKAIRIKIPGMEASKLREGGGAVAGLINDSICICLSPTPNLSQDDLQSWFDNWVCR